MPTTEFLQLIVVTLVAGYVGYLLGRASAQSSGTKSSSAQSSAPIPGPDVTDDQIAPTPRRSSAPPPAGAGGSAANPGNERTPPRRSSAPPPAAAGLMKRDE